MKQDLIQNALILVTGNVPPNIRWCQNLTYLDFSFNKLIGSIPLCIGDLKQLQTIDFSGNQLTGKLCDNQM